jgi:heme/copper-type cytochrome/quinol oxidase subunit 2
MEKEKIIKIVVTIIFIAILGVLIFVFGGGKDVAVNVNIGSVASGTSSMAGFAKVTDIEKNMVATTPVEVVAPKGTSTIKEASISIFKINAENGAFVPNELVFEKGQRVQIEFTAVDAKYDLDIAPPIGAYITAEKGETSIFGFSAENNKEGVYAFSCRDFCPAGKTMTGRIIVK